MLELTTAEKYYRLAVKVNHEYSEAVNNLGTVYYARKSYRRAITEYKRALRINPKAASIWSNLGMGYFARKDYKLAEESWQKAMEIDPDVFENHSTQGVLLQERSVEERAKFHYFLAQGYAKKGENDRALLYIRKALEEGFKDRKKLQEDPAFAALQNLDDSSSCWPWSRVFSRRVAPAFLITAFLTFGLVDCARKPVRTVERLAILPLENLSARSQLRLGWPRLCVRAGL